MPPSPPAPPRRRRSTRSSWRALRSVLEPEPAGLSDFYAHYHTLQVLKGLVAAAPLALQQVCAEMAAGRRGLGIAAPCGHCCAVQLLFPRPAAGCYSLSKRTLSQLCLQVILATPLGLTRLMDVLNEQEVRWLCSVFSNISSVAAAAVIR